MINKLKLPLVLDGATGTNLMRAGMPSGVCTERWILDHPQAIIDLQRAYAQAGSGAVTAPTFETNRYKLEKHGLGGQVRALNAQLVALSRQAVGDGVLVAGNISPTGLFVEPFGDTTFDELTDIYREQAFALRDAGADYIAIETMMSLTEARAALLAAKETGLPVTVTLTVEKKGRTLSGGDIAASLVTLAAMGAAAVGVNCSTGPEIVLSALRAASPYLRLPLVAKPNAGLPVEGHPGVYAVTPEQFAAYLPEFFALGAGLVGGCCGSTPEHIRALSGAAARTAFRDSEPASPLNEAETLLAADERHVFAVIREELAGAPVLDSGDGLADALQDAADEGAAAVKVKIGDAAGAEEFLQSAYLAAVPVVLQAASAELLEAALKAYQGRAAVDGGCGVKAAGALAARYGALII